VLPIRVCASPHRDRKQEEDKVSKSHGIEQNQLSVKEETPVQYGGPSTDATNSRDYLGSLDQMFFIPVGSCPSNFVVGLGFIIYGPPQVNNCDDYVYLARIARDLVRKDYEESPLKEAEIQRYQTILNSVGENQG
jgi:hypothetical protein